MRLHRSHVTEGFTLVELLVVIGIVALLMAMLMPVLSIARDHAKLVQCASNMRQLSQALQGYASSNGGRYPLNLSFPSPGLFWYHQERIGRHITYTPPPGKLYPAGVFVCPNDDNSLLSYSMNVWASSAVDPFVMSMIPTGGRIWASNVRNGSQMVLLAETWSGSGSYLAGYAAPAFCGHRGVTPGQRWGGGIGVVPNINAGRWGNVNCELAYIRHRKRHGRGVGTQPIGRVNLAYADGHVATKTNDELVDQLTGLSRNDSFWSPGF